MKFTIAILCAVTILTGIFAVDQPKFKKCDQSSFCRRCRKVEPNKSPYEAILSTLFANTSFTVDLINKKNNHTFLLKIDGLQDDMFHVTIDEKNPMKERYRVTDALKEPPKLIAVKALRTEFAVEITCGQNKVIVHESPFKMDFYRNKVLFVSANAKGLFKFEHHREKPENNEGDEDDKEPGAWEEDFLSFHDSKPNGPEAIALDFVFPKAGVLFGIPEHADSFALKSTLNGDPYRLYNLGASIHEVDNEMALYGSVPVIHGHGTEGTAGVFWMNSAETWIEIYNNNSKVTGSEKQPNAAHFMSETGIVDAFILLGETPQNTFRQYTELTGVAPLPQQAALAFHQSRWNYIDQQDVFDVCRNFTRNDIPMDTMWLDIDYTDDKKYFTWDTKTFPKPLEMIEELKSKGRHLTIIIDPHIKASDDYYVHKDCTKNDYYTKNKDGETYEGDCWPGKSSYPDLFNPVVRKYLADQYLLENFNTTTNDVFIWNDMNEPSVFDGPETTMPKDNLHKTEMGTFEHRAVHNLFGFMHTKSTFDGLQRRGNGKFRPFILTRSHFSGSQRYAAIWTGDNTADWGYLQMSIKTCLTQAVSGFSFCGSDVGGFFNDPSAELFERWHQAGAFQPFFRAHAHNETKRREPWLYPYDTMFNVRDAIRKRYTYLPLWYVMFYEHERFGYPVMRPMLSHYPRDPEAFGIDNQYMLGDKLLVHPVTQQGVQNVDVYFPRHSANEDGDLWYDIDDHTVYDKTGYVSIPVDNRKIPVFQRGGTIVPKKKHIRNVSTMMKNDPFSLNVCLDKFQEANGTLYADDEVSYDYQKGKYVYAQIDFKNNVVKSKVVDTISSFHTALWIERIEVAGLDIVPKAATLTSSNPPVKLDVLKKGNLLNTYTIVQPSVKISENWEISLEF